jgi:signal transduction histidine kinase
LQALRSGQATGQVSSGALRHALATIQALESRVGDDSNLTLDPDLDTYYLQDIVVTKVPSLLNQLGEVQILLQDSEADGLPVSKYATRFVALEALLRATLGSLNNNLATAYRGNVDGRLRQTVDDRFAAAVASTRALLDALSTSVMGGEIKGVDLAVLKQPSITAVENALNALNVGQAELARLLNARIDTLRFRLYENLAVTAVLVGLSVLIAIMIHRHIVRPLQRLENVANAVGETKDYDLRMDYSGDEEIGHLALAFNSMLAELATARKREMSEQLELSRVSRLTTMGAMTASIAHEIKQPLAAIVANGNAGLRWLAHAEPSLDEARGALKQIVDDGNRAGQVIDGIRGLFKPKGDERTYVDIGKLIREVVGLAQSELQKQQISLRTEIAEGLPPILGDRVQLQQVLLNLVMNASDAMDLVSDRTRILRIRSERHDYHGVLITVEDSGTGIEPQNIGRIFEPLFTTKSNGMRMGLSICRSIIESHGGRLWASPGQHYGTVYQFTLPVCSVKGV